MKYEFTQSITLQHEELAKVDMHSVLNIMNVLVGLFFRAGMSIGNDKYFKAMADEVRMIISIIQTRPLIKTYLENLSQFKDSINEILSSAKQEYPNKFDTELGLEINAVIAILETRTNEWLDRADSPQKWCNYKVSDLKHNFDEIFEAVENYSKGRFHIVSHAADQGDNDYLIEMDFNPTNRVEVAIPMVLQDVMRDTILNSRKYTPLGGHIVGTLSMNHDSISWKVEDNGIGIPLDDIPRIVELGFRAKNVQDRLTMGGGFGLTKAYMVTKQFGGRMWVDSEVGRGTILEIQIPVSNDSQLNYYEIAEHTIM